MIRKSVFILIGMLLTFGIVTGQGTCSLLVERALRAVDDNCSDLNRNTACYAYDEVEASFLQDVGADFFSEPADRADLTYLNTIQTTPLDEESNHWGIAMMSVQANVPDTLPGQAVIFMLMGDTQVSNEVNPDEAFIPSDPIRVTTLVASSNIRLAPSNTGYVLGTAPLETEFEADGLSTDGEWVRIIFEDQPAWISRSIIQSDGSLTELPLISDANRTPMQAFYFSTGAGASSCKEAPDSLMIQGPNSLEVQINANGVDINIGSTIVLESSGANQVSITAINGYAEVGNIRVPGGFTIDAQTDEQGTIQPETLGGLRPMEDEQIEQFQSFEKIDGTAMNYQVQVPTREEIETYQHELEQGQERETIRLRCIENGLSAEQCRNLVGSDTDRNTIYERCVASGLSERICRNALGLDHVSDEGSAEQANGTVLDRCQQAGFTSLEECRDEYSDEPDERIQICVALGYNSRESCRDAFPEDAIEKIRSCVSRGYATKAECDQADSGTGDNGADPSDDSSDEDDEPQNACEDRGLTPSECERLRRFRQCIRRGNPRSLCLRRYG